MRCQPFAKREYFPSRPNTFSSNTSNTSKMPLRNTYFVEHLLLGPLFVFFSGRFRGLSDVEFAELEITFTAAKKNRGISNPVKVLAHYMPSFNPDRMFLLFFFRQFGSKFHFVLFCWLENWSSKVRECGTNMVANRGKSLEKNLT